MDMQSHSRNRARTVDGQPNPTDIHVGKRLRLRRTLLGMSQEKLGVAVGLTFQQVQKYERGANRIGASRLYDLSRVLGVSVNYFFEEMPEAVTPAAQAAQGLEDSAVDFVVGPTVKRETLELVRIYNGVEDPELRRSILNLVRTITKQDRLA
jgi:transcriptional regulator with XRE-family HTH domain